MRPRSSGLHCGQGELGYQLYLGGSSGVFHTFRHTPWPGTSGQMLASGHTPSQCSLCNPRWSRLQGRTEGCVTLTSNRANACHQDGVSPAPLHDTCKVHAWPRGADITRVVADSVPAATSPCTALGPAAMPQPLYRECSKQGKIEKWECSRGTDAGPRTLEEKSRS